jgi:Zn finger protein HypA/HybF involved in hydrogenase expression
MHEVSLAEALLAECERRTSAGPIRRVRVRHASSVDVSALRQAFEMLASGGRLADATLEAEAFDVRLACACGFEGVLGHDDLVGASMAVCPSCGGVSRLGRTAELELLEVG